MSIPLPNGERERVISSQGQGGNNDHMITVIAEHSCWRDNVFVARLWKTIKYEEVYMHAYDAVSAAKESLTRYVSFYNGRRPHTTLDRQTPDAAYFNRLPLRRKPKDHTS